MYHWKFYNKEEISFFTRSKCKFVFAVGSSIYTWQNKKHKFYGIFTWICSIPPRIPQNSSVPNEAEICSPPHLGDLPNHSENEVSPPSPLQEGKKRRRVHQSWIKQQRISSSNFTSKRAAREEFSGSINPPMAAWIVSRIAHVCSKPWNNKKRIPKKGEKKNITPSARRDETKSKTYEEGHGGGIHAHTRSPATAYDEWTEEGGARQGSRRSKATNLQRRKPKRKKKEKIRAKRGIGRTNAANFSAAGGVPSEGMDGVVGEEVELRRASHGGCTAAVCLPWLLAMGFSVAAVICHLGFSFSFVEAYVSSNTLPLSLNIWRR